ncbi:MAG: hypothetical protein PT977_01605 [Acidobacteriota bacterium]|nr:hypothetical protein [Acidobacteriota bacterium]
MSASISSIRVRPLPLLAGAAFLLIAAGAGETARAQRLSAPAPSSAGPIADAARLYARYRTTLSHDDLVAADAAVQAGLDASPGDYELRKFRLRLFLPHHDFEGLLREAEALKRERPGDAELDGSIGDANFDLGRYAEAFAAYDRFAAQRPSTASSSRIALAREIAGDLKGALQSMDLAGAAALPADPEGFAWCRARSARLLLKLNRYEDAEGRLVEALRRVPDHAPSLAVAAEIAARKGLWEPATRLAERSLAREPEAGTLAALVDYRHAMGDSAGEARAKKALADFDEKLPADHRLVHRPLALYFADHGEPARGLAMAERELKGRKDVYGYDAYAWALYRAGRATEAVEPMRQALARGTVDPLLEFHAGAIARAAGDAAGARRHLDRALKIDPRFHVLYATEAKHMLASTKAPSAAIARRPPGT